MDLQNVALKNFTRADVLRLWVSYMLHLPHYGGVQRLKADVWQAVCEELKALEAPRTPTISSEGYLKLKETHPERQFLDGILETFLPSQVVGEHILWHAHVETYKKKREVWQ